MIVVDVVAIEAERDREVDKAFIMAGDDRRIAHLLHEDIFDQILPHFEDRAVAGDVGQPARKVRGEHAMFERVDARSFTRHVIGVVGLKQGRDGPPPFLQYIENSFLELLCTTHIASSW